MIAVFEPANGRRRAVEVDFLDRIENVVDGELFVLGASRNAKRQQQRCREVKVQTVEQLHSPISLFSLGINFLINGLKMARRIAAAMRAIVVPINNFGVCSSFSGSTLPPTRPAIRFPTDVARNQMPIIWPTYLRGESLVIVDSPTGLNNNSPIV